MSIVEMGYDDEVQCVWFEIYLRMLHTCDDDEESEATSILQDSSANHPASCREALQMNHMQVSYCVPMLLILL